MTRRKKRKPTRSSSKDVPTAEGGQLPDWHWWLVAAGLPLVLGASKLNLDFWYDEAYTLDVFVSKPWREIVTDYSAPNNHVLYSLLLRPLYLISDAEFVLRLPSLLLTAGTLAMVFRLARRWAGLSAAVLATLFLGLTQMFLVHTIEVRGYGLSMFLAAWLADLALPASGDPGRRRRWTIVLAGAAFLYVLPTNALFLVPLTVVAVTWTALREGNLRSAIKETAAWCAASVVAGLLYLPIVEQVLDAGGRRGPASAFAVSGLAHRTFSAATQDWVPVLLLAVLGAVCWAWDLFRRPSARSHLVLPLLTVAMVVGPFCLTGLLRILPFVRNFCPMLPFLAVAIGWLLAQLLTAAGRLVWKRWSDGATALVGMVLLAGVALPPLYTYPVRLAEHRKSHAAQDGYYNYYAADFHPSEVVASLQRSIGPDESYMICFADEDYFPLWHYLQKAGMPPERIEERSLGAWACDVYLIKPEQTDYEPLARKCGLPVEVLHQFPLVRDFGYYQLYQSPWTASPETP